MTEDRREESIEAALDMAEADCGALAAKVIEITPAPDPGEERFDYTKRAAIPLGLVFHREEGAPPTLEVRDGGSPLCIDLSDMSAQEAFIVASVLMVSYAFGISPGNLVETNQRLAQACAVADNLAKQACAVAHKEQGDREAKEDNPK